MGFAVRSVPSVAQRWPPREPIRGVDRMRGDRSRQAAAAAFSNHQLLATDDVGAQSAPELGDLHLAQRPEMAVVDQLLHRDPRGREAKLVRDGADRAGTLCGREHLLALATLAASGFSQSTCLPRASAA